jgi:hypothetical protein
VNRGTRFKLENARRFFERDGADGVATVFEWLSWASAEAIVADKAEIQLVGPPPVDE